ncbi:hypothetical protein QCA50_019307 [Cerrena zonata]|uniref:Uncharacterized protein n=1 Tax=Cerrena zonata TaxID=2478898 RepID=A0AAW0FM19_9APHY
MSEGSLPTPPGTSHRKEKENRVPEFSEPGPSTPRVVWAEKNEYRLFENSATTDFAVPASSLKRRPSKSILKATSSFNLAIPFVEEEEREVTPEPSDPLVDLNYLDGPVSRILAPNASLRDLIEAYSILAARIRSSVSDSTDGDASWPLFQPLRKNREAFVSALERDLGRALEDPVERPIINDTSDVEMVREVPMLPSPKDSPRKKRGMSAEQVKYARDLCTTCHSVIKLLGIIFTLPAVCSLFSNAELRSILTALLAIPLAPQLPTPNARKTNALAIWLLQTQRLPEEVLAPAASRIAYAIRRGLDGELGKEGKKGSVSDGLRAVHELSTLYPSTFVPAFTHLLPSIFPHLVGGGMVLRSQACHALGGLALGSAYLPSSPCHEDLADHVVNFLAPVPISSPVKGKGIASPSQLSPSKRANPREDAYIIRTLRATLKQNEPKSPAHGPVWALCVMSHLVVLLRTRVFMVEELRNIFSALFTLALNQTKSSVKGLACVAWRCVFWAWCQNIPVPLLESESEDESEPALVDEKFYEKELSRMLNLFTAATTVLDLGSGSSMVCSLLNTTPVPTHVEGGIVAVHLAFGLLKNMLRKGGNAYSEAVDVLAQLASDTSPVDNTEWNIAKTLPQALFEPNTELLLVDFKSLPTVVRPILARLVDQEDSRNFTTEELLDDDVMQYYFFLLRECVVNHKTYAVDQQLPSEIRDIWHTYLKRKYDYLKEHGTQEQRKSFAKRVAAEIFSLFIDKDRIVFKMDDPDADLLLSPSAPKKRYRMPAPPHLQRLLKLKLTQELWVIVSEVFSKEQCKTWALPLLTWFIQNEEDVVGHLDAVDETRECWASFCARFCLARDPSEMDIFWDGKPLQTKKERTWEWSPQVKGITWMEFIKRWQFGDNQWEMGVMLLSVPFRSSCAWEMSTSQVREWEETLGLTSQPGSRLRC